MTKRLARWLVGALLLGLALLVVLVLLQRALLFPAFAVQALPGAGRGVPGLERWSIEIPGGHVESWFLPGAGVSAERPGPAVLFAHGNGELIDHWPELLAAYRRLGVSVLLPEYRGYGRSGGSPSEANLRADFVRFYDQLVERPDVDGARIVFHGRSLGGGVVCALSRERPPAAVILQSTFTSVPELARRWFVPRRLVRDAFENVPVLESTEAPVLIVHGRRDSLIPVSHAHALKAAARRAELLLYEADHNDCPPDWRTFWREVERFLRASAILGVEPAHAPSPIH